jgi:uncharacterized delta-60 repeat protein
MKIGGLCIRATLLLSAVCSVALAQEDTLWTRVLPGTGNGWDEVRAMASDSQGNVYAAAQNKYDLPTAGKYAIILVKYTSDGTRLWQKRYVGPGYAVPVAVALDQSDNVYVAGTVGVPGAPTDMLVMKYTTNGDSCWAHSFGAAGRTDYATSLALDESANVYVAGMCTNAGTGKDCALVKYRATGESCWAQYYNSSGGADEQAMAVRVSPEGGIFVAGRSRATYLLLTRYERDGTLIWYRETDGADFDSPVRLVVDHEGNPLVTAREDRPQQGLITAKYTPAGDTVWVRHISDTGQHRLAVGVQVDGSNNVVIAGRTAAQPTDATVALVVKYSPDGTELWRAGTYGEGVYDSLSSLAVNSRDEILVAGQRRGGWSLWFQGPYALTRKYSPDGVEEWTRFWIPPDSGATCARAAALVGDELCIGGFCQSICEFGKDTTAFLLRYDDTGSTRWRARFGGPGPCAGDGQDVVFDSDGNVIVCGWLDMTNEGKDAALAKYSPAGDLLWERTYGNQPGSDDRFLKVAVDASGNVYAAGYTDSVGNSNDYLTAKYDASGIIQWARRYDGPANGDDKPAGLAVDRDGNVIVTGKSMGFGTGYDYATVKYSPSGQELWVRRYNGVGDSNDYSIGVVVDSSGAAYINGETFERPAIHVALAIKYGPDGSQLWSARCTAFKAMGLVLDDSGSLYLGGTGGHNAAAAIKVSADGETLWRRTIGFQDSTTTCVDVAVDSAGRFILAGYVYGSSCEDYLTVAFSPQGDELWRRLYGNPTRPGDFPKAVSVDCNGTVFVSGGAIDPWDIVSLGYDSTGRQVWYGQYVASNEPDYLATARPEANSASEAGLLAVSGYIGHSDLETGLWNGVADFLTILHAPQLAVSEQPVAPSRLSALAISASPNPAAFPLHFEVALPGKGRLTLRIYDLSGRLRKTLLDRANSRNLRTCTWDGTGSHGRSAPSGVYLAVATLEGSDGAGRQKVLRTTQKVVVR